MDVGLALPQFDFSVPSEDPLRWETVRRVAERAEALGFDSVWLADHLTWEISRYGGPDRPFFCHDPLVGLAALARATNRTRLGTLVLSAPLRPPAVLAKALASLDVISGGRLVVGLGAGNHEPDFAAAGVPFERPSVRLERLEETVDVLTGLFGGGPFTYAGTHYRTAEARCLPRPCQQPRPPIWLGGRGDRLLDLCARRADGWNASWGMAASDYGERATALDAACERAGRDPSTVARSLCRFALVGENEADLTRRFRRLQEEGPPGVLGEVGVDAWREGGLVGTVEQVREQLRQWEESRVSTLILTVGPVPFSLVSGEDLDLVAAACSLVGPCSDSEPPN